MIYKKNGGNAMTITTESIGYARQCRRQKEKERMTQMKAKSRSNPKAAKGRAKKAKAKARDPWEGATNVVKITTFETAPSER